jgi:hypothetical protein
MRPECGKRSSRSGGIETAARRRRAEDLQPRHAMATAEGAKDVALTGDIGVHGEALRCFATNFSMSEACRNSTARPRHNSPQTGDSHTWHGALVVPYFEVSGRAM